MCRNGTIAKYCVSVLANGRHTNTKEKVKVCGRCVSEAVGEVEQPVHTLPNDV